MIVGVNRFASDLAANYVIHRPDANVIQEMKRRVARLRQERDNGRVQKTLSALESAAVGKDNLVPFVIDAVKAYATIGELCGVLRKVFGEYEGPAF